MRFLFLILIASLLLTIPFLILRKPWAVKLWRQAHIMIVIYAIVIVVAAVVSLIFRWDQIYG